MLWGSLGSYMEGGERRHWDRWAASRWEHVVCGGKL